MIKTTIKNYDVIEVTAKFESRVLQERRLRFYMQDALAFAKESFPDETFFEKYCAMLFQILCEHYH